MKQNQRTPAHRRFAVAGFLLAGSLILTACGGATQSSSAPTAAAAATTEATTNAAAQATTEAVTEIVATTTTEAAAAAALVTARPFADNQAFLAKLAEVAPVGGWRTDRVGRHLRSPRACGAAGAYARDGGKGVAVEIAESASASQRSPGSGLLLMLAEYSSLSGRSFRDPTSFLPGRGAVGFALWQPGFGSRFPPR